MTPKKTTKITGGVCAVSAIIAIVLSMDTGLRINKEGLELIGNAESCRRDPYMCPARVLTVGIGSTGKVQNRRYADEEIAEMWIKDLRDAEKCINDKFKGSEMSVNAFSAMTSAAFNIGCGGLMTYVNKEKKRVPTTIWKKAQARDWRGMCERLPDFNKAGGVELKGLTIRRTKEMELCTKS